MAHNVVYNALSESLLLGAAAPLLDGLASALCMMKGRGGDKGTVTPFDSVLVSLCSDLRTPTAAAEAGVVQLSRLAVVFGCRRSW